MEKYQIQYIKPCIKLQTTTKVCFICSMYSLDDSSTLPELSFDDLLDPSPLKKTGKLNNEDDSLELASERRNRTDETLNTPGHKKPPILNKNSDSTILQAGGSKNSTAIRTNPGNNTNTIINAAKNNGSGNTSGTSGPVLLNAKNVLPKTATQITSSSIKITPKVTGGSLAGKTAVRTSNGQIIYIQKTSATAGTVKPGTTATIIGKQQSSHTGISGGAKPMTIQVLRTADGNYVPIKNTTTGTNVKNTTLTLSPTSLAGKKIITSTGGQVLIKGPLKTTDSTANAAGTNTITTNAITGVKTTVRSSTSAAAPTGQGGNQKSIFVQGSHPKQIIVSNQNIVKLSPKPQTTTTTAAGGSSSTSTSTTGTGQIHAIQIPGKLGLQYVRVLPTSKAAGKPLITVTTTSTPSSTTTQATKTITTSNQPVKILNTSLPQKFTVVQKGGVTTKVVVTQKKASTNTNSTNFSPVASKVQKTIVTVPTLRSLNDDVTKPQQQSLIKPQQTMLNSNANQSLIRKHKISEINSEIQRITTNADNAGPPEIKKPTPNNRVVVVSNQPKILNNSIQQPGRITTNTNVIGSMVQGTKITQINSTQSSTSSNNKLYTLLKPGTFEQKNNPKLYSVLKTSNNPPSSSSSTQSTLSVSTNSDNANKPLINKQYLLQQQQKILQLKKQHLQNTAKSLNASSSSSTYLLPIKIKDEPVDLPTTNASFEANCTSNSSLQPLSSAMPSSEGSSNLDDLVGGVRRKHCNCSKSQCLKLYCDCFANGEFCKNCTCRDCFNNLENEDERQRAIKICLERNPSAFKPKITSSRDQGDMRLHNKGCNCKRSGCLKNYCECYEAKIPCSSNCKCVGCRNVEDRPDLDMDPIDPKIMATIANVSAQINTQKRSYEKTLRDVSSTVAGGFTIKTEKLSKDSAKSFSNPDFMGTGLPLAAAAAEEKQQQCNFITQEVIDATIQCMVTQADECEKNGLPSYQTEKMVMEELGRCLVEIIDFSIRNTDNSYSQD